MPKLHLLHAVTDFIKANQSYFLAERRLFKQEEGRREEGWRTNYVFEGFAECVAKGRACYPLSIYEEKFKEGKVLLESCLCGGVYENGFEVLHARACVDCVKKLRKVSPEIFDCFVEYSQSRKRPANNHLKHYLDSLNVKTDSTVVFCEKECRKQYIDSLGFLSISSIVAGPSEYPPVAGVYMVRFFNNGRWEPLYVGKSKNLQVRWQNHHRRSEISFLKNLGIKMEFRYVAETPMLQFKYSIDKIEQMLIDDFSPKLNNAPVELNSRDDNPSQLLIFNE